MVIISKAKIITFYEVETNAKEPLLQWYNIVLLCGWRNFNDIRQTFNTVDSVGNDRYVFNIGGNKYRIVAMIHLNRRTVYLRFVGTHKEYDKIKDIKNI